MEEEEEEPTEIQGEYVVASGFLDEPRHVEGAQVIPAHELSDEESSMNQPIPAIPAAHDLIVFPRKCMLRSWMQHVTTVLILTACSIFIHRLGSSYPRGLLYC